MAMAGRRQEHRIVVEKRAPKGGTRSQTKRNEGDGKGQWGKRIADIRYDAPTSCSVIVGAESRAPEVGGLVVLPEPSSTSEERHFVGRELRTLWVHRSGSRK